MSLIDDSGDHFVRMAHRACVGSHAINGVAALHSELLKADVLRDFYAAQRACAEIMFSLAILERRLRPPAA